MKIPGTPIVYPVCHLESCNQLQRTDVVLISLKKVFGLVQNDKLFNRISFNLSPVGIINNVTCIRRSQWVDDQLSNVTLHPDASCIINQL